jgi:hypothetical protein
MRYNAPSQPAAAAQSTGLWYTFWKSLGF